MASEMTQFKNRLIWAALPLLSTCAGAFGAGLNGRYTVSTVAGGVTPVTPVAAQNAAIGSIAGMAVDSAGNVYLSTDLHCVFKIDPTGILTRFAGTCRPGYTGDGGPAKSAQLGRPMGMVVDANGAVYIADSDAQVVRKVASDGTITTIAGNGWQGTSGDGGPAIKAGLVNPRAVTVDSAGNVYVAENNGIRRVGVDGTITNLIGNGAPGISADGRGAIKAQMLGPNSVAVDAGGSLYFSDLSSAGVRRISPAGTIGTVAGTGGVGDNVPTPGALWPPPDELATDHEGNLYIAERRNFRVLRASASGAITTIAGTGKQGSSGDGGPATSASVNPMYLAMDSHGTIYIVEPRPSGWSLRKIAPSGTISTVAGSDFVYSEDPKRPQLHSPGDIAVDSAGNLYIAEEQRVRKIDRRGRITTVTGSGSLAMDAKGNLYISQADLNRVSKVSPNGATKTIAGNGTAGFSGDGGLAVAAQLNGPAGVALDSAGNLYIADRVNQRVRKVATDGTISTVAGNGNIGNDGDGGPAALAPIAYPSKLAVDFGGNLYFLEGQWQQSLQVRRVSPAGIISTVASAPFTGSMAVGADGTLFLTTASAVVRINAEGNLETVAGSREAGYSGDGGPALDARFTSLRGLAVDRAGRIYVSDTAANAVRMLTPVKTPKENTADLKVELRSGTGSNRFQIGEEIPLTVVLSSSTPKRYLEPCNLFNESHFGFPQCRFFNHWAFSIVSGSGWVDLTQEFPSGVTGGGPSFEVPDHDLSTQPLTASYMLTHRFRFDAPGEYRVRLAIDVGFDDETTRRKLAPDTKVQPHTVSVVREIALEIVPAAADWQAGIVRKGVEAFSVPAPATGPFSTEFLQNQSARKELCNLGTAEAASALAKLLVRNGANHQGEEGCLEHTASRAAAIEEMERLLVDPDAVVNTGFFRLLVLLLNMDESKRAGVRMISQQYVDTEREKLFAALPRKRGDAQISSLLTVLAYPAEAKGYTLPFTAPVISAAVASFELFPRQSREWLLDEGWDRVRSPLMLPVVRGHAMAGDGQALLRWLELDAPAATAFIREEVVRGRPRFSSYYLRLPEESLPEQGAEIAANFVALNDPEELARAATLLHRYATGAVLPVVLPFIDAKWAGWPCSVRVPALAYLLKVSPTDAEPRLEPALIEAKKGACQTATFFTDVGFLEPSPALERLALAEIDKGPKSFATDAAAYLRQHGSTAVKPLLRERLVTWRQSYVDSGAEKRRTDRVATTDDSVLRGLVETLAEAFGGAHAWLLSTKEAGELQGLLGPEMAREINCHVNCSSSLGTDDSPGSYGIDGRVSRKFDRRPAPMEYLNQAERLHYNINQYGCGNMKALKEKILQFPAGSTFSFGWEFTAADKDEITEIGAFLHRNGYRVGATHNWSFLQPDPPE